MSHSENAKKIFGKTFKVIKNVIYALYLGTVLFIMFFIYLMSMCRENMPVWDRYDLDVLEGSFFIWILLFAVNIISSIVLLKIKRRIRVVIHTVLAVICIICAIRLNYIIRVEVPIYLPYLY